MRHAGPHALDCLEPLLEAIRKTPGLKETRRGIFYRRSRAFLHFHEDATGLYADLRAGGDFVRWPVNTEAERTRLLVEVAAAASRKPSLSPGVAQKA